MRDRLIELQDLSVELGGRTVLRDLTWTLRHGEKWLVRGDNGSGKSTFLKLLAGDCWPRPGDERKRLYLFDGESEWSPLEAEGRIALLTPEMQNRYARHEWELTGREVIATGFENTDLLHQRLTPQQRTQLDALVRELDLSSLCRRPFLELSQGQKRRILLARSVVAKPEVLLLDEFTDGLDATEEHRLTGLLAQLTTNSETTLVLTTHRDDPKFMPRSWRRLTLKSGRLSITCGSIPGENLSVKRRSDDKPEETWKRREPIDPGENGGALFKVHGGQLHIGLRKVLADIDWHLESGEHCAVLGGNGSGKTTLLRLLYGEWTLAVGGSIERFTDREGLPIDETRRRIGFFTPDMHTRFPDHEIGQGVVASGLFGSIGLHDRMSPMHTAALERISRDLHLSNALLESPLGELSYGQVRRLLLARTLIACPGVLLLDEPFDGLDPHWRELFTKTLETLCASTSQRRKKAGTTLVMSSHRPEDIPFWVRRCTRMRDGRIVAEFER